MITSWQAFYNRPEPGLYPFYNRKVKIFFWSFPNFVG